MRVIRNEKFIPLADEEGIITSYQSTTTVEVESEMFTASRFMSVEEYDITYPALRDFIHNALRSAIMVDIRKKLFEGVTE